MPSSLDRPLALWRRLPARARRAAMAGVALLLLWAVALGIANRPAALRRLRGTILEAVARRLPGAELGDSLSIDPLFRVSFGPLTLRADRKGAPPVVRVDRVKVRARWTALLGGRAEPASVRLYGVRIEPGERLTELRALVERLRARPDDGRRAVTADPPAAPRDWPELHLRSLVLALRHDGRLLEVGPVDLDLSREREDGSDDLVVSTTHRRGGRLDATLHRDPSGWRLVAALAELTPEALPAPFDAAPLRWSAGAVAGELVLTAKGGAPATGRLRGRLDGAWFTGDRLAPAPVGPVSVDLDGAVEADLGARRLALHEAQLELLGAVDATLDAEARLGPGLPFSVKVDVPAIDYGALVNALPAALRPPAAAPSPSGSLAFHLALSGPLREPSAWTVEAGLDLSRVREAARRAPPVALRAPFTWHPELEGGDEGPALRVGPENPSFVPLAELPEHVVRAVTTSEDAGFFGHSGFDFEELRNAFAQGAEAGHVVRGASTITQQLAKNLYLSREKTLARKAREALVAVALEASVPKARLLEIYLNIAEWGPGLWGIGPAAQHYFGKPARELTVREAAFLASIIPNPVRYHGYFTRGELDEAWTDRLRVILLHMTEAGALTEDQLVEALDAPLAFAGKTASVAPAVGESAPSPSPSPPVGEREVVR